MSNIRIWNDAIDQVIKYMKPFWKGISVNRAYTVNCSSNNYSLTIHQKDCGLFDRDITPHIQALCKTVRNPDSTWVGCFDSVFNSYLFYHLMKMVITNNISGANITVKFHNQLHNRCGLQEEIQLLDSLTVLGQQIEIFDKHLKA